MDIMYIDKDVQYTSWCEMSIYIILVLLSIGSNGHRDVHWTISPIDMMSIGQFNGDRWIKWTRLTNLQKFLPEVVEKPKQTLKVKSENKANLEWYQSELNAEPKQIFVKSKAKSTQNKIEYYQREKRSEVKANPNQIYVKSEQNQIEYEGK